MIDKITNEILKKMLGELELSEESYQLAKKRYEDLAQWLDREESEIKKYKPEIFPQGSFRLKTVIKPLNTDEGYDLDLCCRLNHEISRETHTQVALVQIIKKELEKYRIARGIKSKIECKHRCLCLEYMDNISFHLDIVPAIPAPEAIIKEFAVAIESSSFRGNKKNIEKDIAKNAIFITDDRNLNYSLISNEWNKSNPEGYAKWFEYQTEANLFKSQISMESFQSLPPEKRKTILQKIIMLLKRHRDTMYHRDIKLDVDLKPISIIITTLASHAYDGEESLTNALETILSNMEKFIIYEGEKAIIFNPVNPQENFADKWELDKRLEINFKIWLTQAKKDFKILFSENQNDIKKCLNENFSFYATEKILKDINFDEEPIKDYSLPPNEGKYGQKS